MRNWHRIDRTRRLGHLRDTPLVWTVWHFEPLSHPNDRFERRLTNHGDNKNWWLTITMTREPNANTFAFDRSSKTREFMRTPRRWDIALRNQTAYFIMRNCVQVSSCSVLIPSACARDPRGLIQNRIGAIVSCACSVRFYILLSETRVPRRRNDRRAKIG